jgi:hypothetical protein
MINTPTAPSPGESPATAAGAPDYAAAVDAALPKVNELLAQFQADPTGDAADVVKALVLTQMANAASQAWEADLLLLQQERGRHTVLTQDAERVATNLTRQNRKLKAELAKKARTETQVREYLASAAAAAKLGDPLDTDLIIEKISAAIGIGGTLIPRVEKGPPPGP